MHIYCTGSGWPTIVLASGLGNDSFLWGKVQPALSRTTRVCSYDRAGYGYSDALPVPRDADYIATELHALLIQAEVAGPIVLMGHSLGGIYIRDYATRYPEEVAGLIFVDASTPLQDQASSSKPGKRSIQSPTMLLTRLAFITNVPRLAGTCSWSRPDSDPPPGGYRRKVFAILSIIPGWMRATVSICPEKRPFIPAPMARFQS